MPQVLLLPETHRIELLVMVVVVIVVAVDIVICQIIGIITNQSAISRVFHMNIIIIVFVVVVMKIQCIDGFSH